MARPSTLSRDRLVGLIRSRGPVSATELAALLGVNRTTIGRTLPALGEDVVALGAARSTRYVLRRPLRGFGSHWPMYRIDASGRAHEWAELEAFHGPAWRIRWASDAPTWADRFTTTHGLWNGFPFFLHDMRPQGFLGRIFARQQSGRLNIPSDPRHWSDDDILVALFSEGDDLPGDLVVGESCLRRALAAGIDPYAWESATHVDRSEDYLRRAQSISESSPGSSVGGEQPKFLVTHRIEESRFQPVLVKFSPPMDQDAGRRWADLLVCEFHAHEVLADAGLTNPGACLLDGGGRRFLEIPRFDRTQEGGRRGVTTLEALAAATLDHFPNQWTEAANALHRLAWIDKEAVHVIQILQFFGELIGNIDMHAGNLAFFLTNALPLRPAPCYDMLPMLWAPNPQGEILNRRFAPQPPIPAMAETWQQAAAMAAVFWQHVVDDKRMSNEFRTHAHQAADLVTRLMKRC